MDENQQHDDGNGVEVKGPYGITLRAHGQWIYLTLILCLGCGFIAYLIWAHANDQKDVAKTQADAVDGLAATQRAIINAQQETTYVLSLTTEEREKLRLRMPDTLRAKINQR